HRPRRSSRPTRGVARRTPGRRTPRREIETDENATWHPPGWSLPASRHAGRGATLQLLPSRVRVLASRVRTESGPSPSSVELVQQALEVGGLAGVLPVVTEHADQSN